MVADSCLQAALAHNRFVFLDCQQLVNPVNRILVSNNTRVSQALQ